MRKLNRDAKIFIAVSMIAVSFFCLGIFYDVLRPVAEAALTRTKNYVAGTKILSADINFEMNALYGAIGTQTYTQKNQIADDQTTTASLNALDMVIGTLHYSGASVVTTDQVITASILALDTKFGSWNFTEKNYIATTDNLTNALDKLDIQTKNNTDGLAANTFTPVYFKQNLRVYPPASGVSTTQVQVRADELVLANASGEKILLSGVSEIGDITSAVTGLVTGAEAGSTLYYIYACRYYSGTSTFIKFSTSGVTPTTLPPDTYYRLVGEVYNNSSSNLLGIFRTDDRVTFADPIAIYNDKTLVNGALNIYTDFALPAPLSLLATSVGAVLALDLESGAVGLNRNIQVISGTTLPVSQQWTTVSYSDAGSLNGPTGLYNVQRLLWPYNGSGYVYAKANINAGNYAHQSLYLWGYVLPR